MMILVRACSYRVESLLEVHRHCMERHSIWCMEKNALLGIERNILLNGFLCFFKKGIALLSIFLTNLVSVKLSTQPLLLGNKRTSGR